MPGTTGLDVLTVSPPASGAVKPPAADGVDVSVCIVNWNCRELLARCLRSLLEQAQGVRFEVIVVDNGSTDGAPELVSREFPQVKLIRNAENRGFSRANNQAALCSRGRYLFFLNNDTEVPPDALRRLRDYAEAHPEVGMLGPRLRDDRGRIQESARPAPTLAVFLHRLALVRWTGLLRRSYRAFRRTAGDPQATRPVEVLMGAALFVRRSVFDECGPWDEDYVFGGEDMELCRRVNARHRVVYHAGVELLHHGRASTRQQIGYFTVQFQRGIVRYLRKSGVSRPALLVYKLLVTLDAPVQVAALGLEYLWRRLRGQRTRAAQSLLALRGWVHFLRRGLAAFWGA
jgi:GT2 family glycosyltransferase